MIELHEFVRTVITDVLSGVQQAQTARQDGGVVAPTPSAAYSRLRGGVPGKEGIELLGVRNIEFDVAISAEEKATGQGAAGLFVVGIGVGGKTTTEASQSHTSRVRFTVPVILPTLNPPPPS